MTSAELLNQRLALNLGTLIFAGAVLHSFLVPKIQSWSHRFEANSLQSQILHLFGEVELVFAIWAMGLFAILAFYFGPSAMLAYQDQLNLTEPMFVFVIMIISATRPILDLARNALTLLSSFVQRATGLSALRSDFSCLFIFGPLSGSFITEPAAMTLTALLLKSMLQKPSLKLAYGVIGFLFVNISIGGALTPYAAPPVLMVAKTWGWDFFFMLEHFAWKTALAVTANALLLLFMFWKELDSPHRSLGEVKEREDGPARGLPYWVTLSHVLILALVVLTAHHPKVFFIWFLVFLGIYQITRPLQDPLRTKESLMVAVFLGGIVFFGAFQAWWLKPLLEGLNESYLYFGAVALTAVTDNAALTYLGSQVDGLSELGKYALVAGAITGGGLTVIANAPNAAGYSLLIGKFPNSQIGAGKLFLAALVPTIIAIVCYWLLPF